MKTTRAKIIDFLNMFLDDPIRDSSVWANKLIESGFVEIEEEPDNYYIIMEEVTPGREVYNAYSCHKHMPNFPMIDKYKIVEVHSVDHCKKYEKMWKELKKWTYEKAFHCYKDKEMVTSVIEDLAFPSLKTTSS